ncbi:MAG: spore protease YyaC [Clostridia bacterium]|nr:spore protease YyaC [Clostridia bacterium]
MDFSFNLYNSLAASGETLALKKILPPTSTHPVILCIGSDLTVGDSLGPIVGTKIKEKLNNLNCFVYGTLSKPITAREVKYMNDFIKKTHPQSQIIAIDAAVGSAGDIGLIKIGDKSIRPGSGANKKLGKIGDVSIMGIIAEKSVFNFAMLSATRLNVVYKMADVIAEGVCNYLIDLINTKNVLAKSATV